LSAEGQENLTLLRDYPSACFDWIAVSAMV
jgi:hypothetical protein